MGEAPLILGPGAGRTLHVGPAEVTVKATADDTGGAFTLLETFGHEGGGPPMHVHLDAVEAFYILEGEFDIYVDENCTRCGPGSFIVIPRGAVHSFRIRTESAKKLNLYAPGAMVGYFDAMAAAASQGEPVSMPVQADIARQHHMEIVGPVPGS